MQDYERENLRQRLDEELLAFRLGRRWKIGGEGWLKNIRQAVGLPVDVVAKRLGVCRFEVHRMEEAEKDSRIKLETLRRAAKSLGCELVYALVPKKGTLEDMATEQRRVVEAARREREWAREEKGNRGLRRLDGGRLCWERCALHCAGRGSGCGRERRSGGWRNRRRRLRRLWSWLSSRI